MKAVHAFAPKQGNELGFKIGDVLDVLDDSSEDGWWEPGCRGRSVRFRRATMEISRARAGRNGRRDHVSRWDSFLVLDDNALILSTHAFGTEEGGGGGV